MTSMIIKNQQVVNECRSLTGDFVHRASLCVRTVSVFLDFELIRNQQVVGSTPTGGSKNFNKSKFV